MASLRLKLQICVMLCMVLTASTIAAPGQGPAEDKDSLSDSELLARLKRAIDGSADVEDEAELLSRVRRVIGGSQVYRGEYPWHVQLHGKIPNGWWSSKHYYCGGALVGKRWLLTAAHCVDKGSNYGAPSSYETPKHWHIKTGYSDYAEHRLVSWWCRMFGCSQRSPVEAHATKIIKHPQYNYQSNMLNDIALVKLDTDMYSSSSQVTGSIALPFSTSTYWPSSSSSCKFAGFGCTSTGGGVVSLANDISMSASNEQSCLQDYGDIGPTRMCAQAGSGGLCKGDSGSPLVCKYGSSWRVAGLASYLRPGESTAVFTRVSQYKKWVQDTMRRN